MTPVIKTYISVKPTGCGLPLHLLCDLLKPECCAHGSAWGREAAAPSPQGKHPTEEGSVPVVRTGRPGEQLGCLEWLLWYHLHQLPLSFLSLHAYWSLPPLVYMDTQIKTQPASMQAHLFLCCPPNLLPPAQWCSTHLAPDVSQNWE